MGITMPNAQAEIESIIKNNPQTSLESLQRADALLERMNRLGVQETTYRLASPFSWSLKGACKGRTRVRSRKSEP